MPSMQFAWQPDKAESNLKKHGVSFATASRAFADPFALSDQDRIEGGERRWQTLGLVEGLCSSAWLTLSSSKTMTANMWRSGEFHLKRDFRSMVYHFTMGGASPSHGGKV